MPSIVSCPSCGGKLRVPDDLRGQQVRCPACDHTFDSAGIPEPTPIPPPEQSPAPLDLPLQLALDEPAGEPRPAPPADPSGLAGAIELKLSLDDEPAAKPPSPESAPAEPPAQAKPPKRPPRLAEEHDDLKTCPMCGKHIHRDSMRCYHCGARLDQRRRGQDAPRRDSEPHRGAVILVVGILSLVFVTFCGPIGLILGIVAWTMGQTDLRKIKAGLMDADGQGPTQAGWICGIIGTLVNLLWTLGCAGIFGVAFLAESQSSRPPLRPQPPRVVPMPAPPQPPQQVPNRKKF